MSDKDDAPKFETGGTPNRDRRREPPVIDATAADLTPAPAADVATRADDLPQEPALPADIAGQEVPASETDAPRPGEAVAAAATEPVVTDEKPHRDRFWPAVSAATLVVLLGTWGFGYYALSGAGDAAATLKDANAALQTRVGDLEQKLTATQKSLVSLAAFDQRLGAIETSAKTLAGGIETARTDARKAAEAATAAQAAADKARELAEGGAQRPTPDTGANAGQPAGVTADAFDALAGKLAGLDARMVQIAAQLESVEQKSGLAAEVADKRIAALEPLLSAPKIDIAATEARLAEARSAANGAALLVVAQNLARNVEAGAPYAAALKAAAGLGADATQIEALRPASVTGAPTLRDIADGFTPLVGAILAGSEPADEGGVLDRLARNAGKLVRLRQVGDPAGNDAAALVARIETALQAGDLAAALAARDKLPDAARKVTDAWAGAARKRLEATKATDLILTSAMAGLSGPKP